jgi:hypothetical protein
VAEEPAPAAAHIDRRSASRPTAETLDTGLYRLRYPYPYRAALAIASDCDGMNLGRFELLHRFLNTTSETEYGPGVGLDVSDSMWAYASEDYAGWANGSAAGSADLAGWPLSLKNGGGIDADETLAPILARYAQCGWIDTIHSIGAFSPADGLATREHAERAVAMFGEYAIRTPVWIDHGGPQNVQNLGAGPSMQGSVRGASCFLADLVPQLGVEFVNCSPSSGSSRPAVAVAPRELGGFPFWWFSRWCSSPSAELEDPSGVAKFTSRFAAGDTAMLWHPSALHLQLSDPILGQLVKDGEATVIGQHLGWLRNADRTVNRRYPDTAIAALRRLQRYVHDGLILVARTSRLLRYLTVTETLVTRVVTSDDRVIIDCQRLGAPDGSRIRPTLEALRGVSFLSYESRSIVLAIDGVLVDEREVVRRRLRDEDGEPSLCMIRWHEPDTTDYVAERVARARPRAIRSAATAGTGIAAEVPVLSVTVDCEQLGSADRGTVERLLKMARGYERRGWFARGEGAAKEWAFIDLADYADVQSYVAACERVHRESAIDLAGSAKRGYSCRFFNPRAHVGDLYEVDASVPHRQGQRLAPRSVEEQGGYSETFLQEQVPRHAAAWGRYWGLFVREPGHRQGAVPTGERLLAYIFLRRFARFAVYGKVLGHAEHLDEGIVSTMHVALIRQLLGQEGRRRAGRLVEDPSVLDIRFVLYSRFSRQADVLSQWKQAMGFRPGVFHLDYAPVASRVRELERQGTARRSRAEPEPGSGLTTRT